MRFGKSAEEVEREPSRGGSGSGGDFIKYLRDGDNTFRILQEPDDWTYFWEHFNPTGFAFPCSGEEDCFGCKSENEKMKKVQKRASFNVLQGFNGQDYVNVFKVAMAVADKLKNRYARLNTITDRDYTITRYKTQGDRYDFDVEGLPPSRIDITAYELKDIEAMLQRAWDDAVGGGKDPWTAPLPHDKTEPRKVKAIKATIAPTPTPAQQEEEPPFEERVYKEEQLRRMPYEELVVLVKSDLKTEPPPSADTPDKVVDWLMELQS